MEDVNNKENVNPIDDMMNFSTDSLAMKLGEGGGGGGLEGDDNQVNVVNEVKETEEQLENKSKEEVDKQQPQTSSLFVNTSASLGPSSLISELLESSSSRQLPATNTYNVNDDDDDDDDDITPEVLLPSNQSEENQVKAGGDKLVVSFSDSPAQIITSTNSQIASDRQPPSEAVEYADDLARELINDTNLSLASEQQVNSEHSQPAPLASPTVDSSPKKLTNSEEEQSDEILIEDAIKVDDALDMMAQVNDIRDENRSGETNILQDDHQSAALQLEHEIDQRSEKKSDSEEIVEELKDNYSDRPADNKREEKEEENFNSKNEAVEVELQQELNKEETTTDHKERVVNTFNSEQDSKINTREEDSNSEDSEKFEVKQQDNAHFQTAIGNSLIGEEEEEEEDQIDSQEVERSKKSVVDKDLIESEVMEFGKNYSDDLLMGQGTGSQNQQGEAPPSGVDLADYELPPYSGSSSSGSEANRQQSPIKRKSSSGSANAAQPSSSQNQASIDLKGFKNLLLTSYSKSSHILQWKKPIETGVYFSIGATLIIALTFFSIISVVAYTALGIILTSGLIRAYKSIMQTLNKSPETPIDHVWNEVLNLNVSLSTDKLHELIDVSLGNLNSSLVYLKQVLLFENKIASLKIGGYFYLLTYIGSWFNGMTLITITYLALFSLPIAYEKNKSQIDQCYGLVQGHICATTKKITSMVSGGTKVTSGSKKQN